MQYPDQWEKEGSVLTRVFTLHNFVEAIAFVNKVALLAEQANHHPDMEIFAYKKVAIRLTTHDAGNQVTEKDIALAKQIDAIAL